MRLPFESTYLYWNWLVRFKASSVNWKFSVTLQLDAKYTLIVCFVPSTSFRFAPGTAVRNRRPPIPDTRELHVPLSKYNVALAAFFDRFNNVLVMYCGGTLGCGTAFVLTYLMLDVTYV